MVPARGVLWEGAELPLSPRPAWVDGRFNLVTCLAILPRGLDGSARPAGPHASADTNHHSLLRQMAAQKQEKQQ